MANQERSREDLIGESNMYKGMVIMMAVDALYFADYSENRTVVNGQAQDDRTLRLYRPVAGGKMLSIEVPLNEDKIYTKQDAIMGELKIQEALGIKKKSHDPDAIRAKHKDFIGSIRNDSVRALALNQWKNSLDTLKEAQRNHNDNYINLVINSLETSKNNSMLNESSGERNF